MSHSSKAAHGVASHSHGTDLACQSQAQFASTGGCGISRAAMVQAQASGQQSANSRMRSGYVAPQVLGHNNTVINGNISNNACSM